MGRKKKEVVAEEETKPKFTPEVVDDGVLREEAKENPTDLAENSVKVVKEGNWKVVSYAELVKIESEGALQGKMACPDGTIKVLVKEK